MDNFYGTLRIYMIISVIDPNSMEKRTIGKKVNLVTYQCQYSERESMLQFFKKGNPELADVYAHFIYMISVD